MIFKAEAYREFARLTAEMASLAEAQDFENLSDLCVDYECLSAALDQSSAQSVVEIAEVESTILNILDNQRRIAESAGPWLLQVRILLRENRQEKSLIDAYRAEP